MSETCVLSTHCSIRFIIKSRSVSTAFSTFCPVAALVSKYGMLRWKGKSLLERLLKTTKTQLFVTLPVQLSAVGLVQRNEWDRILVCWDYFPARQNPNFCSQHAVAWQHEHKTTTCIHKRCPGTLTSICHIISTNLGWRNLSGNQKVCFKEKPRSALQKVSRTTEHTRNSFLGRSLQLLLFSTPCKYYLPPFLTTYKHNFT